MRLCHSVPLTDGVAHAQTDCAHPRLGADRASGCRSDAPTSASDADTVSEHDGAACRSGSHRTRADRGELWLELWPVCLGDLGRALSAPLLVVDSVECLACGRLAEVPVLQIKRRANPNLLLKLPYAMRVAHEVTACSRSTRPALAAGSDATSRVMPRRSAASSPWCRGQEAHRKWASLGSSHAVFNGRPSAFPA